MIKRLFSRICSLRQRGLKVILKVLLSTATVV